MNEKAWMVRHFLAALAYRFRKAVKEAPKDFYKLEVGGGVRPPLAIVYHMNGVLGYGEGILETGDEAYVHVHPQLDWAGEVRVLHETLASIDARLGEPSLEDETLERLLQGPLSDAMTHVGQLAMLRRVAQSPLRGENFYKADIRIGQVSEQQPDPVSSDPL